MGENLNSLEGFSDLTSLMMDSYLLMVAAQASRPVQSGTFTALDDYPALKSLVEKNLPEYNSLFSSFTEPKRTDRRKKSRVAHA